MKDRISIDLHPCTKLDPECAADQMAIYLDDEFLIGYASNKEGGAISLIVHFDDEDVAIIHKTVSKLVGVKHRKLGMVPDVPDELLEDVYDEDDDDDDNDDLGSQEDEDSE